MSAMDFFQPGVVVDATMRYTDAEPGATALPVFVGLTATQPTATGRPARVQNFGEFEALFGGADVVGGSVLYHAVRHYFDNRGGLCHVLSAGVFSPQSRGAAALALLTRALANTNIAACVDITLISVPDSILLVPDQSAQWLALWGTMLDARQGRPDIFCLMDTPAELTTANACRSFSHADAMHGAAYWPHLVTDYRHADGTRVTVPPSAAAAACFHVTDSNHGIWKAPANEPLAHVVQPARRHQLGSGLFDDSGVTINLIRNFSGRGTRIWGARTLAPAHGDSAAWRYVQVRRMASYIQAQLKELLGFAVFEPNYELTWVKVKSLAGMWLTGLWKRGGLAGMQVDDAFRLYMGVGESMTEDDLLQGRMVLQLQVALYYPAEFVQVSLQFNTLSNDAVQANAAGPFLNRSVLP